MKKITKFLYKYRFLIILILALLSRVVLLNGSIDFFDSSQYIWRSDAFSLQNALSTGHAPYHPGYIFFTYIFNQLFQLLGIDNIPLLLNNSVCSITEIGQTISCPYQNIPEGINNIPLAAALPSAIFGSLTVLVFYAWVEKMFKTKIALFSALLVTITPYYWISNQAILVDPTMIFFYILSLYLFYLWLDKENYWWLILSGFAFGWSMWAHTQIAFWFLGFVGLLIAFVKLKNIPIKLLKSIPWITGPLVFIGIYLWLLVISGHNETYREALVYLLKGNAGDHMPWSFFPGIRNYSIIMSIFLAGLSVLGLIKMLIEKTKEALFLLIWLVPGLFISALYLYANLYGRSSMMAIFPAMIAVSYLLMSWQHKKKIVMAIKYIVIILAVSQLLYISLPIVKLYATQPAPYQEMDKIRKELEQGGLAIMPNLAKTLSGYDNYEVVWETPKTKIDSEIQLALDKEKPIFIDASAIRFPYFKYDGQNWEIQSTEVGGPGEHESMLAYLFTDFNFDLIRTSQYQYKTGIYRAYKEEKDFTDRLKTNIEALEDKQGLVIGRIVDKNLSQPVSRLLVDIYSEKIPISRQRINYNDWLYRLYNSWQKNSGKEFYEPINWTYTDKNGYFISFAPENELIDPLKIYATSYSLSINDVMREKKDDIKFTKAESTNLIIDLNQQQGTLEIDKLDQLTSKLGKLQTYYLIIKKQADNKIFYQYTPSEYELEFTNTLEAESMAHEIGQQENESWMASRDEAGFLVFGPWLSLPSGKYKLTLKMKINNSQDRDEIGLVEITAENQATPLVQKTLHVSDFDSENDYKDIVLEFESEGDSGVEFRIKSIGAVDLQIDNIILKSK